MTGLQLAPGAAIPWRNLTRHVGIFGATGTGKTTTAAALVDRMPCPVVVLDAKGDLERAGRLHAPRMSIGAMGADFVARALDLSEPQAGALQVALAWAEDSGRAAASLADLRALLSDTARNADALAGAYGLVSPVSIAAVQRALLRLERACPEAFGHGAPDWRRIAGVNVIACRGIADVPGVYGAFSAHVLDSLYRGLGEIGDAGAPGLAVMIDESHLLFDGATPAIVRRIEQVTRLIRSRGVALIYVTQSPADLPDSVLGQLGTRLQHGLNAATPRQVKALRAAADTMGADMAEIQRLGIGQALLSVAGAPGRKIKVAPRGALDMGPADALPVYPGPARVYDQAAPQADVAEPEPESLAERLRGLPWQFWAVALVVLLALIQS